MVGVLITEYIALSGSVRSHSTYDAKQRWRGETIIQESVLCAILPAMSVVNPDASRNVTETGIPRENGFVCAEEHAIRQEIKI